jgi:hypothetical protein
MKYKVGDKVLVKDLDWYNKNKDNKDEVLFSSLGPVFTRSHSKYAGRVMTIDVVSKLGFYILKEDKEGNTWYDEMIEGLAEDEHEKLLLGLVPVTDKGQEIIPHKDYEIKQEGEKFYLVKKKKGYPKTYKECMRILGFTTVYTPKVEPMFDYDDDIIALQKLKNCRDAYWKIAGEEMGLGKPWKPDFTNDSKIKYCIGVSTGKIQKTYSSYTQCFLAFPTSEMRDAFKENFNKELEICKELL